MKVPTIDPTAITLRRTIALVIRNSPHWTPKNDATAPMMNPATSETQGRRWIFVVRDFETGGVLI